MRQGCRQFKIGDTTGFICGGEPADHTCNEDATIYILKSGERIPMTDDNFEKYKDEITGGSVACSICGRAMIDNASYL